MMDAQVRHHNHNSRGAAAFRAHHLPTRRPPTRPPPTARCPAHQEVVRLQKDAELEQHTALLMGAKAALTQLQEELSSSRQEAEKWRIVRCTPPPLVTPFPPCVWRAPEPTLPRHPLTFADLGASEL